LKLQDEIALQVINALALHLGTKDRTAINKRFTENAEAYDLYVKGRYHWNKRSYGSLAEAERLFRNAIEKDPNFALAYVGLADSLIFYTPSSELRSALLKAIELDPNLGEAWASQGFMLGVHSWRWKEAEDAFKKSIELNPGYATAHHWYGVVLEIQGKHEQAKAQMRRALEIDPLSYNFLADLGQVYYFNREYQTAEEFCKKALDLNPEFPFAHGYLRSIYLQMGRYELAIEEGVKSENFLDQSANDTRAIVARRQESFDQHLALYREGGIRKYLEYLLRVSQTDQGSLNNPNTPYVTATFHTLLGEKEKALDDLERAYQARAFLMAWVKADPVFDSLRSDVRFKAILQKMNLPAD
jgi:tetratricopeptide (TPR) repeat protein